MLSDEASMTWFISCSNKSKSSQTFFVNLAPASTTSLILSRRLSKNFFNFTLVWTCYAPHAISCVTRYLTLCNNRMFSKFLWAFAKFSLDSLAICHKVVRKILWSWINWSALCRCAGQIQNHSFWDTHIKSWLMMATPMMSAGARISVQLCNLALFVKDLKQTKYAKR